MSDEKEESISDILPTDTARDSSPKNNEDDETSTEKSKLLIYNYCKTAIYYLMFVAMGAIVTIPGPTLLDLAQIVNVRPHTIGIIFTLRSVGYLVGAFSAGVLLDYFSMKSPTLAIYAVSMAAITLSIPFCKILYQLQVLMFLLGVSVGGLNNGTNVCLLNLWGRKADSYFLALHFSFGVGAFLGPIIAGPFLEAKKRAINSNTTATPETSTSHGAPKVATAFAIVSSFAFFMTLVFVVFSIATLKYRKKVIAAKEEERKVAVREPGAGFTAIVLIVTAIAIFFVICIETGYSSMILTYAVEGNLQMDKHLASYLNSVFWGAYMLTRFICIFIATRVHSEYFIAFDVVTLVISGLILACLGRLFEPATWVGTALAGIGVATLFPSTISWVGRYIHITFKVGSLFFIMGSISEMIWPVVLGSYVKIVPDLLFFFALVCSVACFLLYYSLYIVFSHRLELYFPEVLDAESVIQYYGIVGQVLAKPTIEEIPIEKTEPTSSDKGSEDEDFSGTSKDDREIPPHIQALRDTSVEKFSCEELDEKLKTESGTHIQTK